MEYKLTLEYMDGRVLIQAENISMVQLATMCGAVEQFTGLEAYRRGNSLEDIKDNMLDIHLAAMHTLTEYVIREKEGGEQNEENNVLL